MTVRQISAATTCLLVMALCACGAGQASPGRASTRPTAPAPAASASPLPATPVSPTQPTSTGTPPRNDSAALEAQAKSVTTKFMQSAFTVGYPDDPDLDAYLRRIQPLLSPSGYAQQVSLYRSDPSVAATIKGYYDQKQRVTVKITSSPKVVQAGTAGATTTVKYRSLLQHQVDGSWQTSSTGSEKTETVSLANANDDGIYLVDHIG